jgi:hypothetical protein
LCALVLAPHTFSRNRFHDLYEHPELKRVRRRAKRVRGIIRQLLGKGREKAEIVGDREFDDRVLLRYKIPHLAYERTTALSALEAATIHYALGRAGQEPENGQHTQRVETALARLSPDLSLGPDSLIPPAP